MDPASLIQCHFVLQVGFRRPVKLPDVAVRPFGYREGQSMIMPISRAWLRMTVKERPSGITGACWYKDDLFEPKALHQWMGDYKAILAKAAAKPSVSLGRLADR